VPLKCIAQPQELALASMALTARDEPGNKQGQHAGFRTQTVTGFSKQGQFMTTVSIQQRFKSNVSALPLARPLDSN
jgi:hypothetical protein